MRLHFFKGLLFALSLLVHLPGTAEDIDLFVGVNPATISATDVPKVLIILDNTANWNTVFTNQIAALASVVKALPEKRFKVGLMMFTESGGGNGGESGAYVRAAIRLMDSNTKPKYEALIKSLDVGDDKGAGGKFSMAMEEAFLMYSGGTPYSGNQKNKTDFAGNVSGTAESREIYALAPPGNALASKAATKYNSLVTPGSCSKNYIIYISNGPAQDNNADLQQATDALKNAGGSTTQIPLNPSGSQDNVADEWARFMKVSSLGITVYTVDINKDTTGQGLGWTALLKSVAAQSSGKYFDIQSTGTQIADALNNIFSEIQSVNSVFASVSLPVSVNTQGTFLNQVFVGMFRPDSDANPRWAGNLKQYKIGQVGSSLLLQDADNASAINNQTGFISECARSFWTPSAVDTEWANRPSENCLTVANSQGSNYPDGNIVDKGAQAYMLRRSSARTVKTCSPAMASCTALTTFNNVNVTQAMLGATDGAERDALINWTVGADNKSDDIQNSVPTNRRLSTHGDVVHSRPVAINLAQAGGPANVVVFYGANDGMLRAINGNRTSAIGTIPAGGELWSFMPPEFYINIKRLRDNKTPISFPYNTTGTPTPQAKPYGMDGSITAYQGAIGGSNKAIVYATMRRGGRALYAFDVTNSLTAPDSPTLKWKIGCPNATNDTDCTIGLNGIGQTWSSLKSFTASGYFSGTSPMLITGGGYGACDDYDALSSGGANHNCTAGNKKGHYVYVLDANTGDVLKTFDTGGTRGVVADITLVRNGTGQAIYGYTADLGGNVYRINLGSGAPASWTMTKIASFGCDTTAACTANRKFMFAPSVVADNGNYVIMLGSGDREKPLTYYASSGAVSNHFFAFTDKPTTATNIWPGSVDCGTEIVCKNSLLGVAAGSTPSSSALSSTKGWYLGMSSTEQVVTSAVTVFGVLNFSTHTPAVPVSGSCSNLGTARVYNVAYDTVTSANGTNSLFGIVAGGGLPPSPVAGRVTLDNNSTVPFCIGCSKDSPLQASAPPTGASALQPKGRLYWYIQK